MASSITQYECHIPVLACSQSLFDYFVVKSISFGFGFELACSQVQDPAGREPQAQALPLTGAFSLDALSQVHWPAGRARHEHRAPLNSFSVEAFSQLHARADFWPQEQVACLAVKKKRR